MRAFEWTSDFHGAAGAAVSTHVATGRIARMAQDNIAVNDEVSKVLFSGAIKVGKHRQRHHQRNSGDM